MVDIVVLQSASYVAAAIGVCIAAFYYALNLRETTKNRRANLATTLMQSFMSEEGAIRWVDLLKMQWSNFDDYVKKYDSAVNTKNFAERCAFWTTCESLGFQYRKGIVDLETIYNLAGPWIISAWMKFKPIIEEYRRWEWGMDIYSNWENLAGELSEVQVRRDSDFKRKYDAMVLSHIEPQKTSESS
jgi:hypothetical protein